MPETTGRIPHGYCRHPKQKDATLDTVSFSPAPARVSESEISSLKATTKRDARTYVKTLYGKLGLGQRYVNDNTGIEFSFSKGSFDESVGKQNSRNPNYSEFVMMLSCFDEIIKNAVVIESHSDKYVGTVRENGNLKKVNVFLSAFRYDENWIVPVQIEVKEFGGKDNKIYVAVTLNKVGAGVFALADTHNVAPRAVPSSNTIRVADIFKNQHK